MYGSNYETELSVRSQRALLIRRLTELKEAVSSCVPFAEQNLLCFSASYFDENITCVIT